MFIIVTDLYIINFYHYIGASQVAQVVKNPAASAGEVRDRGSIPGWGRSREGRHGNPLQYSCLENPIDRGGWQAIVRGVTRVRHDLLTKPPI